MLILKMLILVTLLSSVLSETKLESTSEINPIVNSSELNATDLYSDVSFMVSDLWDEPLLLPGYCSESNSLDLKVEGAPIAISLDLGCKGEWIHEGEGCFICKGMSWGTFKCCDGDKKNCDP